MCINEFLIGIKFYILILFIKNYLGWCDYIYKLYYLFFDIDISSDINKINNIYIYIDTLIKINL